VADDRKGVEAASAQVFLEDALACLTAGQWDDAVRHAGHALAVAPTVTLQLVALDALAVGHNGSGNYDAACAAAIEALRLGSSDSVGVVLMVSEHHASEGDIARSLGLLEEAHAASATDLTILRALALRAERSGDYPGAIRWYDDLDRLDPAGAAGRSGVVNKLRVTRDRNTSTRALLARIGGRIAELCEHRVISGPFSGQILDANHDFGWIATLLGSYEMELHPAIEHLITARPHRVINVGCSGGYYAVGFARRVSGCQVMAFDIDPVARATCLRTAQANRVADRLVVKTACTIADLQALAGVGTAVFSDCEGYELKLLDPDAAPALRLTTIIVELHDIWVPGLTARLLERFAHTHDIAHIAMVPRNPDRFQILNDAGLNAFEKSLAVSEFRPPGMTWAYMVPRA
jgi:tetratricopeptide (TPR) repeat protein